MDVGYPLLMGGLLVGVGGLLSVQAAANVQLGRALRGPVAGAALQLAVAAGLLLAAAAASGVLGAFGGVAGAPGWHLLGGLGSAVYVTAGIVLFPRLGAVVTVGLFIAGQMLAALLIDALGLLGAPRTDPGAAALAGVVAVLVGAAVIVRSQGHGAAVTVARTGLVEARRGGELRRGHGLGRPEVGSSEVGSSGVGSSGVGRSGVGRSEVGRPGVLPRALALAFAVLAGAALPVQGALNAQLRVDLASPLPVAAWSFLVATAAMALPLAAAVGLGRVVGLGWVVGLGRVVGQGSVVGQGRVVGQGSVVGQGWVSRRGRVSGQGWAAPPRWSGLRTMPWWGWLGGLVGAGYVTSVFLLLPQLGAAATIALTVAGQQLAGVAVDHYGLLRMPRRPVGAARLLGVAVLLGGVGLLQP